MISLFVARSPNIVAGGGGGHLLDSVDVAVGGTVRLECRAEGIPKPKVTWRVFKRNGQKRKSNFSEYGVWNAIESVVFTPLYRLWLKRWQQQG